MAENRSIVYVDGFNLYYGALRGGPYKWLDLAKYFSLLRNDDELQHVRYFTAQIVGPTANNQSSYLLALETLPLVTIYLGKFKSKQIHCQVPGCAYNGNKRFSVPEEKRSDVNIAIHMLHDAYQNQCDRFVLVSGDSDLVPAINMIKAQFPKKQVIVYVPSRSPVRGAAVELRSAADKDRSLPLALLKHAQLPAKIADGSGGWIRKPASW